MAYIWNESASWNGIKPGTIFSRRTQRRAEGVNREEGHGRSRIYFNFTIVTRISGIPFYRRDLNEASKLLSVHWGSTGG